MSYRRDYDDYRDRDRGYDRRGGGGWDDGYGRRGDDGYGRHGDRGYGRHGDDGYGRRDGGHGGYQDRRDHRFGGGGGRDHDRSFGGGFGGRSGGGSDFRRGGDGGRGGGGGRGRGGGRGGRRGRGGGRGGMKRPGGGDHGESDLKKRKNGDNWLDADKHAATPYVFMDVKPEDLEENWVFVVCPQGKRRVLVAANEITQSYNSNGIASTKFNTCLPSGSEKLCDVHKAEDLTVFDTYYNKDKKMYSILDMMHWKHYPYYETEADFRFFCLQEKFSQLDRPSEIRDNHEYALELLPKIPFSDASLLEALSNAKEASVKVEGLMFIQKESLYEIRDSTNYMWIRIDKLSDVLGLSPPEGLEFVETSSRDETHREEQEQRKKVREQRDAATAAKEVSQENPDGDPEQDAGEDAGGDGYGNDGGDGNDGDDGAEADNTYSGNDYAETGEQQELEAANSAQVADIEDGGTWS